jgi:hypothetical protein
MNVKISILPRNKNTLYEWGRRGRLIGFGWMPEGKKPLGRRRRTWVYNIKMDIADKDGMVLTGLVCFRIKTCGELSLMR